MKSFVTYFWILCLMGLSACQMATSPDPNVSTIPAQHISRDIWIASYNVENLFDPYNDPQTEDEEFLPRGRYEWTEQKYQRKLDQIGKALGSIGKGKGPDIFGVVEVENRKVLEDLINRKSLREHPYQIVHEESTDQRGIDVALVYDATVFQYEDHWKCRGKFPEEPYFRTRDALVVKGLINQLPIHFIVNHWPSRREGRAETEHRRLGMAQAVRNEVDKLYQKDPDANIVILGDFNDDPRNKSISDVLDAQPRPANVASDGLFNPMYTLHDPDDTGTLTYQGKWNLFDQFLISESLLSGDHGLKYISGSARIHNPESLQVGFGRGKDNPRRAIFRGKFDDQGVSDHFPIYMRIQGD